MSWTNNEEKNRLFEWACRNQESFSFQEYMAPIETYYCPFDNTSNVCDYGFATIAEMEKLLDDLWRDAPVFGDIKKACAVAAFKRQPESMQKKNGKENAENRLEIPDFVYIF